MLNLEHRVNNLVFEMSVSKSHFQQKSKSMPCHTGVTIDLSFLSFRTIFQVFTKCI